MGYRFNVPPNWPAPPSTEWTPPQNWKPDPAWGPAPEGWNFWVEDPTIAGSPQNATQGVVQPGPPRNWFMRHKVLTTIGAILLLGVFSSIANAAGGGAKNVADQTTSTPSAPSVGQVAAPVATSAAPSPKAATPKPKPAPKPPAPVSQLGKVVKDGKFAFRITSVKCGIAQVGSDFLSQKAQGQYCRVKMTVQNIGSEAQTMFADNQYLFDTKGRKFSADSTAGLYDDSSKMLFEEINPGNSIEGNVFFDVPKGIKISKFELHDSMYSGGVEVNF